MFNNQKSTKIDIFLNEKSGNLELAVPFALNGLAKGLPSRRWNKTKGRWVAPLIKRNAEYILSKKQFVSANDVVWKRIEESLVANKAQNDGQFPPWYVFKIKPMKHQMKTLEKLYPMKRNALFLSMGLGKTFTAINMATARVMENKIDAVLVFCPVSIKSVWEEEVPKYCPLPSVIHSLDTSKKKKCEEFVTAKNEELEWLIVGIESMSSGSAAKYAERFALSRRCMVVVDESSKIKNHPATRTERIIDIGNLADYRTIMSGTPVSQGFQDLYAQFEFLDTNIIGMGSFYSFRNRYMVMGGFENRKIIGYDNTEELLELIAPHVMNISKEEGLPDLPDRIFEKRVVQLTKQQKEHYESIRKTLFTCDEESDVELLVQTVLEGMTRLQQIVGGNLPYNNSNFDPDGDDKRKFLTQPVEGKNPKLEELINIFEETNEPAIIWCKFKPEITAISERLKKEYGEDSVVTFQGKNDSENYKNFVNGTGRFFVCSYAAAYGLTIIRATLSVYYSNDFSYEVRYQSMDRNHRKGQQNKVTYIDLIAENTVDDKKILPALMNKADVASYVSDSLSDRGSF